MNATETPKAEPVKKGRLTEPTKPPAKLIRVASFLEQQAKLEKAKVEKLKRDAEDFRRQNIPDGAQDRLEQAEYSELLAGAYEFAAEYVRDSEKVESAKG